MSIEKYFKRSQEKILPSPHGSLLTLRSIKSYSGGKQGGGQGTTSAELSDHDLEEARKVQQVFTRRKSDDRQTRCIQPLLLILDYSKILIRVIFQYLQLFVSILLVLNL